MVAGTWPSADFWLDRVVHPGHWFLFANQDAEHAHVSGADRLDHMAPVDGRNCASLDWWCDWLALESSAATLRGARAGSLRAVLSFGSTASANERGSPT